jgi:hypothetical protein
MNDGAPLPAAPTTSCRYRFAGDPCRSTRDRPCGVFIGIKEILVRENRNQPDKFYLIMTVIFAETSGGENG